VFKQNILHRMALKMQLGKRIFNLVIKPFPLNKPDFAFAGAYRIPSARNFLRVEETSDLLRGGN